jgi:guanylate kinase
MKDQFLIVTAPSGSGKSTIIQYLLKKFPQLAFSISATTRAPRGEEQDGQEYHFLDKEIFLNKVSRDEFIEYEEVYEGVYYGTLKSEIERITTKNQIAVLDIDVEGAYHVKNKYDEQVCSIYIKAPSLDVLEARLRKRGTENEEQIRKRMKKAAYEMEFESKFDHIIINANLEQACTEAEAIIEKFIAKS